jgi:1-acyl-sn-glycerol-3-phosphate acyltransferase
MTDPVIALRYLYAFVVAKMEVQNYPVLGRGAAVTGVIYVDRSSVESRKETRKKMEERFEANDNILIFPEGTVKPSHLTGQFKIGSFDIAANNNIPIVPISVEYSNRERDYWRLGQPLYMHFLNKFSKLITKAYVTYNDPIYNKNPWKLLEQTQGVINNNIKNVHPDPSKFQVEN